MMQVRPGIVAFVVVASFLTACGTSTNSEAVNTVPHDARSQKPAEPAPAPPTRAQSCEPRFTPTGTALSRVALDTRTGQQCRTAESGPSAFLSLPLCLDLFERDRPAGMATSSPSPAKPCEQRFVPIGTALSRAAVDTRTGQLCRTAENAAPAFRSAPLCSDVTTEFPD